MTRTTNPIRAILEDAGWTPSELAALLGVSPQRINTLWNGHRRWSDRMVNDLYDLMQKHYAKPGEKVKGVRKQLLDGLREIVNRD